jgi:hypothetical protein
MNLLNETIDALENNGKSIKDVKWCGSTSFGWFSWDVFVAVANIDYDNGYGGQEIASDLVIVGDNWWLERYEYDGAESWDFKTILTKTAHKIPKTVCNGDSWATLIEMNSPGGKYGRE